MAVYRDRVRCDLAINFVFRTKFFMMALSKVKSCLSEFILKLCASKISLVKAYMYDLFSPKMIRVFCVQCVRGIWWERLLLNRFSDFLIKYALCKWTTKGYKVLSWLEGDWHGTAVLTQIWWRFSYTFAAPNAELSSYPGYFRESHWKSMGLPEIFRVIWIIMMNIFNFLSWVSWVLCLMFLLLLLYFVVFSHNFTDIWYSIS